MHLINIEQQKEASLSLYLISAANTRRMLIFYSTHNEVYSKIFKYCSKVYWIYILYWCIIGRLYH